MNWGDVRMSESLTNDYMEWFAYEQDIDAHTSVTCNKKLFNINQSV